LALASLEALELQAWDFQEANANFFAFGFQLLALKIGGQTEFFFH
jgi:hypothetical protein